MATTGLLFISRTVKLVNERNVSFWLVARSVNRLMSTESANPNDTVITVLSAVDEMVRIPSELSLMVSLNTLAVPVLVVLADSVVFRD